MGIALETGSISHCRIQVPWSSSGDVEVDISDVEIVFRLYTNSDESVVDEAKWVIICIEQFVNIILAHFRMILKTA